MNAQELIRKARRQASELSATLQALEHSEGRPDGVTETGASHAAVARDLAAECLETLENFPPDKYNP